VEKAVFDSNDYETHFVLSPFRAVEIPCERLCAINQISIKPPSIIIIAGTVARVWSLASSLQAKDDEDRHTAITSFLHPPTVSHTNYV
jgi:hypothetical protein